MPGISNAAIYVTFPNGQPYAKVAFDTDEQVWESLANLAANTETSPKPQAMDQHCLPYSKRVVPIFLFDMVLTHPDHRDRVVLRVIIRTTPVQPTLKPGEHHDTHKPHPPV